jgi:hypothetical protein
VVLETLVAASVLAVKAVTMLCKGTRRDFAGAMLVEALVENSFQPVIAVKAVQACCVADPWDMVEAILVEYESVGE